MESESKLDAATRQRLAGSEPDDGETLSVFLHGRAEFGDAELGRLREHGAQIRTVAGDVLTASVPLSKVADVAAEDFVARVEGSSPLHPD